METPKTAAATKSYGYQDQDYYYVEPEDMEKIELENIEIKKVLKEYLTFKSLDGRVERQKLREKLKSFI